MRWSGSPNSRWAWTTCGTRARASSKAPTAPRSPSRSVTNTHAEKFRPSVLFVITPGADWACAIPAGLNKRAIVPAVAGMLAGHLIATPGHLALWQPEERLLVVGDALWDYDVGWVNLALDGPEAAETAPASLRRVSELRPRVLLTAHGPLPTDPDAAPAKAVQRFQRLVDDPQGAVWYGARRILAFALMIRNGIPVADVEPYLHAREWLQDAARPLRTGPEELSAELVRTMSRSGAVLQRDGYLYASRWRTAPVTAASLDVPFPRSWPPPPSSPPTCSS